MFFHAPFSQSKLFYTLTIFFFACARVRHASIMQRQKISALCEGAYCRVGGLVPSYFMGRYQFFSSRSETAGFL